MYVYVITLDICPVEPEISMESILFDEHSYSLNNPMSTGVFVRGLLAYDTTIHAACAHPTHIYKRFGKKLEKRIKQIRGKETLGEHNRQHYKNN